jgi:hypothetical protein
MGYMAGVRTIPEVLFRTWPEPLKFLDSCSVGYVAGVRAGIFKQSMRTRDRVVVLARLGINSWAP